MNLAVYLHALMLRQQFNQKENEKIFNTGSFGSFCSYSMPR